MKNLAHKLKAFVKERKYAWTSHEYGSGGCETCGYGAPEFDAVDMEALDKQIDEFCKTFKDEE